MIRLKQWNDLPSMERIRIASVYFNTDITYSEELFSLAYPFKHKKFSYNATGLVLQELLNHVTFLPDGKATIEVTIDIDTKSQPLKYPNLSCPE